MHESDVDGVVFQNDSFICVLQLTAWATYGFMQWAFCHVRILIILPWFFTKLKKYEVAWKHALRVTLGDIVLIYQKLHELKWNFGDSEKRTQSILQYACSLRIIEKFAVNWTVQNIDLQNAIIAASFLLQNNFKTQIFLVPKKIDCDRFGSI